MKIKLALSANPSGGKLSGTLTRESSGGVATFDDLRIDRLGNGYTLTATATYLTSASSDSFNVAQATGRATYLAFGTQPQNNPINTRLPAFTVEVRDNNNQLVTDEARLVTLSFYNNPGANILHASGALFYGMFELVDPITPQVLNTLPNRPLSVIRGMAYNPQDGMVYGTSDKDLFSIEPATGAMTTIATNVLPYEKPRGLAFKNGILYGAGRDGTDSTYLYTLNLATGAATKLCQLKDATGRMKVIKTDAMETDPATGTIYGVVRSDAPCSSACRYLATMDLATCQVQFIGEFSDKITGITFLADGTLVGVTGDNQPSQRETLFTIDKQTARLSLLMPLGTGGKGEQITWVPAALSGTISVMSVNGVATFDTVSINGVNPAGTGYNLLASTCGLSPGISTAFSITGGTP